MRLAPRWLLTLFLVLTSLPGPAHGQLRINGTVVDAQTGTVLPGVNVFIDGELNGAATDDQGRFVLTGLSQGSHVVVASMIGYENQTRSVTLKPSAPSDSTRSIRFKLRPTPIEMKGVTVEGSREEWLERLEDFRESFFGTAPNSDRCSFVNPEVLTFDEKGQVLIAHAEQPLRVRNEALGYELTFHLPRYRAAPDRRTRFGPVEFDTLQAQSPEQRAEWKTARRETYRGSYEHFLDALEADALDEEGFKVWISDAPNWSVGPGTPDAQSYALEDASKIFERTETSGHAILSVPDRGDHLKVRYLREPESRVYVRMYRSGRSPEYSQTSVLLFVRGKKVILDLRTGAIANGHIVQRGYWGWYETAATLLPDSYRPPS